MIYDKRGKVISLPYIDLKQPKIEPRVLDIIFEYVWDEVSDKTKQTLVDILKIEGIDYSA